MRSKMMVAMTMSALCFGFSAQAVSPVEHWSDFSEAELQESAGNLTSDVIFIREKNAIEGPAINVFVDGQYLTSLLPGAWRSVNVCAGDNRLSGGFVDPSNAYQSKLSGGSIWSLPADTQVFFLVKADADGQPRLESIDPDQGKALVNSLPQQNNTLPRVQANRDCSQHNTDPLAAALATGSATLEGVQFASDSAELQAAAIATIDHAANVLSEQPTWNVVVVGHTDSSASPTYNQRLSERRAQRVAQELIGRGIAPERVRFRGAGESTPIADNATAQGRAQNRRVELVRQ